MPIRRYKSVDDAAIDKALAAALAGDPLLSGGDAGAVRAVAAELIDTDLAESAMQIVAGDALQAAWAAALPIAAQAVSAYRAYTRMPAARAYADALPVRKAAVSGDGGGRFYWRMVLAGGEGIIAAVRCPEKNRGDYATAKRAAAEAHARGQKVIELIPPDIDPQADDERQRNVSAGQPDGLTVRQRTKKH